MNGIRENGINGERIRNKRNKRNKRKVSDPFVCFVYFVCFVFSQSVWAQSSDYQTAVSLVQQRKFDQAFPILKQLLDRSPDDLKVRNLLGIALSAAGRRNDANEQFKKVLELDPKFFPALKNLAVNELALGLSKEAEIHFEEVLKQSPQDPTSHWGLAEIAFASRNFERAVSLLQRIPLEADANIQFQAGLLLAKLEKYEAAARRFEMARKGYPDPYQAGYNLVFVLFKNGDFIAAIRTGEEMLAGGYRKAELYNLLAQAYEKGRETKKAYDSLRAATDLEPQDETNYLDLIALCMRQQNYDLSLEIAGIGARLIPGSHRLHLHRGVALVMKGSLEDAIKEFQTAGELAPEDGLPQVALGLALIQMDRQPEAIAHLRRQIERRPRDPRVSWLLGEALSRSAIQPGSEEEKEAIGALEKSIQLDARLPQSRALLGKILLRRGDVGRAAEQLEKALELDPEDMTATYQLAQALQRQGQTERARQLFEKVSQAKSEKLQPAQRDLLRVIRENTKQTK